MHNIDGLNNINTAFYSEMVTLKRHPFYSLTPKPKNSKYLNPPPPIPLPDSETNEKPEATIYTRSKAKDCSI
jgi:hypothetical protein